MTRPVAESLQGEVVEEEVVPFVADQPEPEKKNGELAVIEGRPVGLFGRTSTDENLAWIKSEAEKFRNWILDNDLALETEDGVMVLVEGWEQLGTMQGVFAVVDEESVKPVPGGWQAYARAITRAGEVVGGGTGMATRSEPGRKYTSDHDLAAMAQTRAVRLALRRPLGIFVRAAGFDDGDTQAKAMTPKQRKRMFALLRQIGALEGKQEKAMKDWLTEGTLRRFGERISGLNRGQAKQVMDGLEERLRKIEAEKGVDPADSTWEPDGANQAQEIPFE